MVQIKFRKNRLKQESIKTTWLIEFNNFKTNAISFSQL